MANSEQDAARKEFVSEAEEILERLSADIMEFEKSFKKGDIKPDLVNKLFREFHSLKGLAGMLGFKDISETTHNLENMLDKLRMGKINVTFELVGLLFESLDVLLQLVSNVNRKKEGDLNITKLVTRIYQLSSQEAKQAQDVSLSMLDLDEKTIKSFTEYEEHRLLENIKAGKNIFSIKIGFGFDVFDAELKSISEILSEKGEIISTLPWTGNGEDDRIFFKLIQGTSLTMEEIEKIIDRKDAELEDLLKGAALPEPADDSIAVIPREEDEAARQDDLEKDLKSISRTVRVDIDKLDRVMNIVGELVISRAAVDRISKDLGAEMGMTGLALELNKATRQLERKLNDLQQSVIDVRMVPIGQIFNKLSRAARKITNRKNKKVELEFFGGDTELDKVMIEEITNPLLHIIRNSIDHGIEVPAERKKKGKDEVGKVVLGAYQKGNSVVIEVKDDGRGISNERIRKLAVEKGLISADDDISTEESTNLIFSPGFSSAETVSDVSGRGVGLDVVKSNISDLKGTINVITEEDEGTVFQITLPITLAIIQILVVKSGNKRFCIPLSSVSESIRITPGEIKTVDRKEVYSLRDITLPLIRLNSFFGLSEDENRGNHLYVVVVQAAEKKVGLVVDRLLGQQEVVIKSIGAMLSNLPGIAGACELGENQAVLVLDIGSLLEKVTIERGKTAQKEAEKQK